VTTSGKYKKIKSNNEITAILVSAISSQQDQIDELKKLVLELTKNNI
jgi:cell division protein FtsL